MGILFLKPKVTANALSQNIDPDRADATGPGGNATSRVNLSLFAVEKCFVDVNNDGSVDGTDFGAWLTAFNNGDIAADLNFDGQVNGTDFGAWLTLFNRGCPWL